MLDNLLEEGHDVIIAHSVVHLFAVSARFHKAHLP
jgi:hypothetical protein